jgi:hypothetical protein
VQGCARREDGCSFSPQETSAGEVRQGTLCGVASANLPLYLAYCEESRVFIEDKT